MTRLVVFGASGQVGFELLAHLAPLGDVVAATRSGELPGAIACARADLGIPGSAAAVIARERPQVVVNAAAYTAVDRAEDEPDQALRANGLALAEIGSAARDVGALVVHYSTDYVFPGDGTRPYREDDATGPRSAYGESKLAGEQALADSGADHMVFRTAWVYAARGQNFLRTMLRLGRERDQLKVVDDQRGAPTPAALIAAVTAQVVARWLAADVEARAALSGVMHLASAGETSWCGFARAIFERAAAAGLVKRAPEVLAIASHEFPAKATRPAYSVLDCSRLRERTGLHLPDWRTGLDRVIADLADRHGA
jgi:dTDP-4-dehydrorhamnose reductase